jgi:triphosphoribosyl-dephospho-CoA synthetase
MLGEHLANEPYPNEATLLEPDSKFIKKNLSPGGSADLLALTYFLYFLCKA